MFIELIVFMVLLLLVIAIYKRVDSVIYYVVIVDIYLKLMSFVANNLKVPELTALITKYLPKDLYTLLTSGFNVLISNIITLVIFVVYTLFLIQLIKILTKKIKV